MVRALLLLCAQIGQCVPPATYATGARPRAVVTADVDEDGDLDVIVANSGGNDLTLYRNARGRLSPASPIPAGTEPSDLAAGDFDRDGHVDLAIANHETSGVTVLLGDGRGGF